MTQKLHPSYLASCRDPASGPALGMPDPPRGSVGSSPGCWTKGWAKLELESTERLGGSTESWCVPGCCRLLCPRTCSEPASRGWDSRSLPRSGRASGALSAAGGGEAVSQEQGGLDHSFHFLFWRKTPAHLCWLIILQPLPLEPAAGAGSFEQTIAGGPRGFGWKNGVRRGGWIVQGKSSDSCKHRPGFHIIYCPNWSTFENEIELC